jgi:hypothetical protein
MEHGGTMRKLHIVLPVLLLTAIAGCGGSSPTPASPSPVAEGNFSQPPAAPGPCVVGFDELHVNGAAFATHAACGLTIATTAASWQASTTYGHPAPFVQFVSASGTTTTGEISLTVAGGTFAFVSVDIYSSTTKIPYEINGLANGAVVFTISNVQGNTFGNFATIGNPRAAVAIDTLRIRLTNPAAPCCSNPVGLDNVRVIR